MSDMYGVPPKNNQPVRNRRVEPSRLPYLAFPRCGASRSGADSKQASTLLACSMSLAELCGFCWVMSFVSQGAARAKQNKFPMCTVCHLDVQHTAKICIAFRKLASEHQLEKEIRARCNTAPEAEHQEQAQKTCEEEFEETVKAYKQNITNETYKECSYFNCTAE
eukprot:1185248-Rhodomonas_salina.2